MSITLSKTSSPSTSSCVPGRTRIRLTRFAVALKTISFTSVDLPEPETPVTQTSLPTGNSTSIPFRLCIAAPRTVKWPRSSSRRGGTAIWRAPERNWPVTDSCVRHHVLRLSLGDDVAAVLARARPHVDEPVGGAHHLLVVLDDEHGVAEPLQPLQRPDQLVVVALVEADRGLVEDVEDADELRADLGREPQPLGLAAGERLRGPVELEVADADVVEEGEPLPDLLDDPVPDQLLGGRQAELVEERERARDGHPREVVDRAAADGDGEHLGLEAGAVARRAGPEAHVLLDPLALRRGVGLAVAPLERLDDPLEGHRVRAPPPHPVPVLDVELVAVRAVEEELLLLGA